MRKFYFATLGILLSYVGVMTIVDPVFYHSGYEYTFDFTEIKWPFGLIFIALGLLFFWSAFRKSAKEYEEKAKENRRVLMCLHCKKPYRKKDLNNMKCPTCEIELEQLEGFYERHPELKNDKLT